MYSGDIFIDDDGYDDAEEEEEAVGGKNNSAIIIKLSQKCCCKDIMLLPNEPVKLNILQLAKKKLSGRFCLPIQNYSFRFACVEPMAWSVVLLDLTHWRTASGFEMCVYRAFDVGIALTVWTSNIIHLNKFQRRVEFI